MLPLRELYSEGVRIALVSIGNPEDVNVWSGIPHSILQELRKQATSVHAVALSRGFRYLYTPAKLWHRFRKTEMQLDRHPLALREYRRQIEQQLRRVRVDAVLATSSIPVTGLRIDVPVLFWTDAVFDAMVDYYPAVFRSLDREERALCHRQEGDALLSATHALYSSDWAVRAAQRYYEVGPAKTSVAEFGANLCADLCEGEAESLAEARSLRSPLNLLFVGVDWKRKGGDIALEATRLLNERGVPAVLHVAGCASPASEHVRNYGFLNRGTAEGRNKLTGLFREASVFLFPTRAEAAGIVFAEASSFALPIVTTDTGGVGTYVVENENGVRLPMAAGAADYADAVERIWRNPALYRALSLGARRQYEERLNWQVSVAKALRLAAGGPAGTHRPSPASPLASESARA